MKNLITVFLLLITFSLSAQDWQLDGTKYPNATNQGDTVSLATKVPLWDADNLQNYFADLGDILALNPVPPASTLQSVTEQGYTTDIGINITGGYPDFIVNGDSGFILSGNTTSLPGNTVGVISVSDVNGKLAGVIQMISGESGSVRIGYLGGGGTNPYESGAFLELPATNGSPLKLGHPDPNMGNIIQSNQNGSVTIGAGNGVSTNPNMFFNTVDYSIFHTTDNNGTHYGLEYSDDNSTTGKTNPLWIPNWQAVTDYVDDNLGGVTQTSGTFTPILTSSAGVTYDATYSHGSWMRVGDIVTIRVSFSIISVTGTPTGQSLTIGGFPTFSLTPGAGGLPLVNARVVDSGGLKSVNGFMGGDFIRLYNNQTDKILGGSDVNFTNTAGEVIQVSGVFTVN